MRLFGVSRDYTKDTYLLLDSIFVKEFLADAPDIYTKVYLFGLYLQQTDSEINYLEDVALYLNTDVDTVNAAIRYWVELGVLEYDDRSECTVRYRSLKSTPKGIRKYDVDKYADFNQNMQDLFPRRQLTPAEMRYYYDFIEETKMQPDALYLIASYCVGHKTTGISKNYILTVARKWLTQYGIRTVEEAEAKLNDIEGVEENLKRVMREMKCNAMPDFDDKQQYEKWTKSWGFSAEGILVAARIIKRGNIAKLDTRLDEYYRNGVFSPYEIEQYEKNKAELVDLTARICGVFGQKQADYSYTLQTYIMPWLQNGYDGEGLFVIAEYLQRYRNAHTLNAVADEIQLLFAEGIIDTEMLRAHYSRLVECDGRISEVLSAIGSPRPVRPQDRTLYAAWTDSWGFSQDGVLVAARLISAKVPSIGYLNNFLAYCKNNNAFTAADIERVGAGYVKSDVTPKAKTDVPIFSIQYTAEEMLKIDGDDDTEGLK